MALKDQVENKGKLVNATTAKQNQTKPKLKSLGLLKTMHKPSENKESV